MLRPGDLVLTRNEFAGEGTVELRPIEEVYVRRVHHLQVLTLLSSNGTRQTLLTTNEHPVYVPNAGWVRARELQLGDQIAEPDGGISTVVECHWQRHPEGVLVYNFRVAEHHTYFVRQAGSEAEPVWVHNWYEQLSLFNNELEAAEANIGRVPAGQTVAADALARRTLSGWTNVKGFLNSSDLVSRVMVKAREIGYEFSAHFRDQGVIGRFFASHAEPQLSLFSDVFAVSRDVCPSCRQFLSSRAVAEGRTFVVQDPKLVWTFTPDITSWAAR
jgi:hypothetical protein